MLPLDDIRWKNLEGGYRVPYDASEPLRQLMNQGATPNLWEDLWNELHHQGDVGPASYASVPWLVEFIRRSAKIDWNPLAIVAVIELERPSNPAVPDELADSYFSSIQSLPGVLGTHQDQEWNALVLRSAVTCIALARGQHWYAKAYFELDDETVARWFSEEFGWDFGDAATPPEEFRMPEA